MQTKVSNLTMKTTVMRCLFILQLWQATHILHPPVGLLNDYRSIQEALIRVNAEGKRVIQRCDAIICPESDIALGAINPSTPASFTA